MTEIVKVSSKSAPNAVAGALAGILRIEGRVEIQVVGAGALNQAVKAIAIARTFMAPGRDLCCQPTFADIEIDGEPRTAMHLLVECAAHHLDGGERAVTGDRDNHRGEAATDVAGADVAGAGGDVPGAVSAP